MVSGNSSWHPMSSRLRIRKSGPTAALISESLCWLLVAATTSRVVYASNANKSYAKNKIGAGGNFRRKSAVTIPKAGRDVEGDGVADVQQRNTDSPAVNDTFYRERKVVALIELLAAVEQIAGVVDCSTTVDGGFRCCCRIPVND